MASKRDYYEVLGVGARPRSGTSSGRFAPLRVSPDKNDAPDASDRFKEMQEAFAVLSDEQKRAQYDRFGHDGPGMDFGNMGGFNVASMTPWAAISGRSSRNSLVEAAVDVVNDVEGMCSFDIRSASNR